MVQVQVAGCHAAGEFLSGGPHSTHAHDPVRHSEAQHGAGIERAVMPVDALPCHNCADDEPEEPGAAQHPQRHAKPLGHTHDAHETADCPGEEAARVQHAKNTPVAVLNLFLQLHQEAIRSTHRHCRRVCCRRCSEGGAGARRPRLVLVPQAREDCLQYFIGAGETGLETLQTIEGRAAGRAPQGVRAALTAGRAGRGCLDALSPTYACRSRRLGHFGTVLMRGEPATRFCADTGSAEVCVLGFSIENDLGSGSNRQKGARIGQPSTKLILSRLRA